MVRVPINCRRKFQLSNSAFQAPGLPQPLPPLKAPCAPGQPELGLSNAQDGPRCSGWTMMLGMQHDARDAARCLGWTTMLRMDYDAQDAAHYHTSALTMTCLQRASPTALLGTALPHLKTPIQGDVPLP